jgi:hypothetical protein
MVQPNQNQLQTYEVENSTRIAPVLGSFGSEFEESVNTPFFPETFSKSAWVHFRPSDSLWAKSYKFSMFAGHLDAMPAANGVGRQPGASKEITDPVVHWGRFP